jgi:outer membrane receptor protein involved in Fe transport
MTKKIRSILLLSGLSVAFAVAGQNLTGTVTGCFDSQPLAGVSIKIQNSIYGVVTDTNGKYAFDNLKTGVYKVEFSYMGMKTVLKEITLSSSQNRVINICMEGNVQTLDEVMVTGKSGAVKAREIRESPMAVSVIEGAKLRGLTSGIEDILKRSSGLTVRQSGGMGSASRISVHGLEGKRVAVFFDGFALNSPDGSFDINDVPVDIIERIEVYKGIVPAEYGGDGLGGAINIETREVNCDLVGATLETASFGTYKGLFSLKKVFDKPGIQIAFGGFYNRSDNNYMMNLTGFDPDSPYSKVRRNNDFYLSSMLVPSIIFTKLWFDKMEIEFAAYQNKKELQNIFFDSRYAYTYGSNLMPILKLEKTDFFIKGLDLKMGTVAATVNQHLVDTVPYIYQWNGEQTPSLGETSDNLLNLSDDRQFELRNRLNIKYSFPSGHRLNLNNQSVYARHRPKDDYLTHYLGYDPSGFPSNLFGNITGLAYEFSSSDKKWQNTISLKAYYLQSKIYRTEEIGVDASEFKKMPGVTSSRNLYWGYLDGVSYELLRDFRVKFSYEHAVRLPDTQELFGDGTSVKSAVNLRPEQSDNFSAGIILDSRNLFHLSRVQLEANAFYMATKDLISLQPADRRLAYQNLDNTLIKGLDADLKVDVIPELYTYFNITWQDLRNNKRWETDDHKTPNPKYGKQVPNIPSFYYNAGLEFHMADFLLKEEFFRLFADYSHIGKFNYAWKLSDRKEQEFRWMIPACHNLSIGVQQSFLKNKISFCFTVDNIFDTQQYNNLKMPLAGRSFKIKIRYNWFRDKSEGGAMSF